MKTHCLIQDKFCPNGYTHCCMECKYGKANLCDEDCLNHASKCGLCVIEKDDTTTDSRKAAM